MSNYKKLMTILTKDEHNYLTSLLLSQMYNDELDQYERDLNKSIYDKISMTKND